MTNSKTQTQQGKISRTTSKPKNEENKQLLTKH
jgi:hypothetical protein